MLIKAVSGADKKRNAGHSGGAGSEAADAERDGRGLARGPPPADGRPERKTSAMEGCAPSCAGAPSCPQNQAFEWNRFSEFETAEPAPTPKYRYSHLH